MERQQLHSLKLYKYNIYNISLQPVKAQYVPLRCGGEVKQITVN